MEMLLDTAADRIEELERLLKEEKEKNSNNGSYPLDDEGDPCDE